MTRLPTNVRRTPPAGQRAIVRPSKVDLSFIETRVARGAPPPTRPCPRSSSPRGPRGAYKWTTVRPVEILGVCAVDPKHSSWYTVVRDETPTARPAPP